MSRVHQLYHDLQKSRTECAALRSEAHRLRNRNKELKTSLEAAQEKIAALTAKGMPSGGFVTDNGPYIVGEQSPGPYYVSRERYDADMERMRSLQGAPAAVEVICMDARQYESLSVERAGVKL